MTLTTHIQLQRAVVTAVEENWKSYYQYSIVQCKDSSVCQYTNEWKADNTTFEALFFQNDSICERDYPWRLIGTRGPVNPM